MTTPHGTTTVFGRQPQPPDRQPDVTYTVTTQGAGGGVESFNDLGQAVRHAQQFLQQHANPPQHQAPTLATVTIALALAHANPLL